MLVYYKEEVNIYYATTKEIDINFRAILTGYLSEKTGIWHILLKEKVENETTNTLVVNRPNIIHVILNVYGMPSIEKVIYYLHATSGFTAKETWIKSIRDGNFVSWPGLTLRAMRRNFPEYDET